MAVTVTLAAPYAKAQNACENVFAKTSAYRDVYAPLKSVHNTTEDLVALLKTKPQELTSAGLEAEVRKIENLAEEYFKEAGFTFEKLSRATTIKNLKNEPEHVLSHSAYRLIGSASGDEAARLINGIQVNPKYQDHMTTFVFDPLYKMKYLGSNGHFLPANRVVVIGPHVIAQQILGLSSTLRHETQHSIEQMKLLNGEMTLARAIFTENSPNQNIPYADLLRADELETHIRDIRTLTNVELWASRDKKIAKVMPEEKLNGIKALRQEVLKETKARLEILITNSLAVIKNLEDRKPTYTTLNNKTDGVEVNFLGLPPPYSNAKFEFLGVLTRETMNDSQKVETVMKEFLSWEKSRTEQIAKELKVLTGNEAPL